MFYSLQGEGRHAGRAAVFCRFAGCNLWSGRERDRATAACNFCDTDFVGVNGDGGGRFNDAWSLAKAIDQMWGGVPTAVSWSSPAANRSCRSVTEFVSTLHEFGFEIALETNGSIAAPGLIDWITRQPQGHDTAGPNRGRRTEAGVPADGCRSRFIREPRLHAFSPAARDGPDRESNTAAAIAYCLQHPRWRLSVQTHKFMGIR